MPERDDFTGGTRGASMSWGQPGQRICMNEWRGGLIIGVEKSTARDKNTQKPKFWPDAAGNPDPSRPIKQRILTVVTNERDPNNPLDQGIRSMYIDEESRRYSKKGTFRPGEEKEGTKYGAYLDALAEAGVPGTLPEVGGFYYQCLYGEAQGAGSVPRGLWKANYQRPTPDSIRMLDQYVASSAAPDDMGQQQDPGNPYGNGHQPQQQNGHQQPTQAPSAPPQWSGGQQQPAPTHPTAAPAANHQPYQAPGNGAPYHMHAGSAALTGPPQNGNQPPPNGQQSYGPPEQGPPGTAWNGQPPAGPPQQFQQGNPYGSPPPQHQPPQHAGNPYQQ